MFEGRLQKKAQYGFSAPPSFCADDKSEGMHHTIIEEMKSVVSDHDFSTASVEHLLSMNLIKTARRARLVQKVLIDLLRGFNQNRYGNF